MTWHPFELDQLALDIVLKARKHEQESKLDVLNQAYKMRAACAYGLERFWGEHLRLAAKDKDKGKALFIADVWTAFVGVMHHARPDLKLPADMLSNRDSEEKIQKCVKSFWKLRASDHQICLTVLTSFCDSIVWWTQRLKLPNDPKNNE
jgi:hypothetical protein